LIHSTAATTSASAADKAVLICLVLFHDINLLFRNIANPVVLLKSTS
jgi:hypothetical protein